MSYKEFEPVMVQRSKGGPKVEAVFLESSPNGELISVMFKSDKCKGTLPSARVSPARTAPPSAVEVEKRVADHIDDANARAQAHMNRAMRNMVDNAILAKKRHPSDDPAIKKVMEMHPEIFRPESVLVKMRQDFYDAQKLADVKPEEPVDIYCDIDYQSDGCVQIEHPADDGVFNPTAFAPSWTYKSHVFKGYLFRENLPHITKDQVRQCPYFFDEEGRVQYCADAAVFTKLGEVGK